MKLTFVAAVLSCASLAVAEDKPAYPKEDGGQFVMEKLDVTSLPSPFRPKKEKGKRAFADYGAQKVDEKEAIIETADAAKRLMIKVLDQKPSGRYVCVAEPAQNGEQINTQSVILLKRKDQNALLRGREAFREFAACPVIGETDSTGDSYGGD